MKISKDTGSSSHSRKIFLGIGIVVAGLFPIFLVVSLLLPWEYRIQAEVTIPRSAEKVWYEFTQTEHWIGWFSGIRSVNRISTSPQGVGSQFEIVSVLTDGKKVVSNIEITDWVEGKYYAHRHLSDIMKEGSLPITNAKVQFEFEPDGREKTRVAFTGTFEAQGLANKWVAWLVVKSRIEKAMFLALTELKQHIEKAEQGQKK